jgi:hypothetical protein
LPPPSRLLLAASCLIDGEVVICGEDGIPVFDRLRYGRRPQSEAVLFPPAISRGPFHNDTLQASLRA